MGEVYRAHDTKLRRDVAIKVLPEVFARDPERLARFRREAQLLASLSHPNIAAIHAFEELESVRFLVLEYVPGETLAEMLARHGDGGTRRRGDAATGDPSRERQRAGSNTGIGLPLDEILQICRQMADALEEAHEKTIVHRDLKPANVKVTPEGVVKV